MNICSHCLKLCVLMMLLCAFETQALQYKSRLFNESNKDLSESESQSLAALQEAFNGYQDEYQIATTGQYLARQMVIAKEYQQAAEYYYKTLQTQTLVSEIAQQLRRELAEVLLRLKRYDEVEPLLEEPLSDKSAPVTERLLLARASLGLQQFHRALQWLQPLNQTLQRLDDATLKQMTAIYFSADAISLATDTLQELLRREPDNLVLSRQLVGLFIRQKAFEQALDLWSLTDSKGLLIESSDRILLADLYQRQGAPEKAARLLASDIEKHTIAKSATHYYKLFEFWYQARELQHARDALWQSVRLSQDPEHALILAELLQQAQQWQPLHDLILFSCNTILADKFVGRYNLMLGIALFKLQRNADARRALINASLVSGVKTQARQWLKFMNATPASIAESRTLWGPCLPEDPSIDLPDNLTASNADRVIDDAANNQNQISDNAESAITNSAKPEKKLVPVILPKTRFYGTKMSTSAATLQKDLKKKTFHLIKNLIKSGGKVDGPMHLLFDEVQTNEKINVTIAFPYSGAPTNRSGHRVIRVSATQAVALKYQGPVGQLATQWQYLVQSALTQGLLPTGEARMLFLSDDSNGENIDAELQLIVK